MKEYQGETADVNKIVVLAGNGLPVAKSVKEAIKWYPDKVVDFKPAKQ